MADAVYVTNPPSPTDPLILQYDDSFEGLLTAVFESYLVKPAAQSIVGQQHQRQLDGRYRDVITDADKAERVLKGLTQTMGRDAAEQLWIGFLSANSDKSEVIYRFVRTGMRLGKQWRLHLTDASMQAMEELTRGVSKEACRMQEFVRFSRLEGDVYYAKISPEHDVLTMIVPFFENRFNTQPFIIHDEGRQIAAVYDTKDWVITSTEDMNLPALKTDEWEYRQLWKRFYDAIAIKERLNPKLHQQHMPKKYWRYLTEMTTVPDAPTIALPSDISRLQSSHDRSRLSDSY